MGSPVVTLAWHNAAAFGKAPLTKKVVTLAGKTGGTPGAFIRPLCQYQGWRNDLDTFEQQGFLFGC